MSRGRRFVFDLVQLAPKEKCMYSSWYIFINDILTCLADVNIKFISTE